jgi:hypothetical protein
LIQAQAYSAKLSVRVGKAWASKKIDAANGKLVTKNVPAWLEVENGEIVPVNEYKGDKKRSAKIPASVVTEASEMAAKGLGGVLIAKKLLAGKSKLSVAWMISTLSNRAVLGKYQPNKCEVVPNYYPPIVDQSVFDAVRAHADSRRKGGRVLGVGHNPEDANNLFAGRVFDGDRKMDYAKIGVYEYLVSRSDINDARPVNRLRYEKFEKAFIPFLRDLNWREIAGEAESAEVKVAQSKLEVVLGDLDRTTRAGEQRKAVNE